MRQNQRPRAIDLWEEPEYPGATGSTSAGSSNRNLNSEYRNTLLGSRTPSSSHNVSNSISPNTIGKRKASYFTNETQNLPRRRTSRQQRPQFSQPKTDLVSLDYSDEEIFPDDDETQISSTSASRNINNIDVWVLTEEAQGKVCVTPRISLLAAPYFAKLKVVGEPLPSDSADGMVENLVHTHPAALRYLQYLIDRHHGPIAKIDFSGCIPLRRADRQSRYTYYRSVKINGETVSLGDIIITSAGQDGSRSPPEIPHVVGGDAKYAVVDLFWFGKVLSIRSEDKSAHVQWFQHARNTFLGELAHPQELFLMYTCDDLDLTTVIGKGDVTYYPPGVRPEKNEWDHFFYSFSCDPKDGSFKDIETYTETEFLPPPDNCPYCIIASQNQDSATATCIKDQNGTSIGISLRDSVYHPLDMILIRGGNNGPCKIAQILQFQERTGRNSQDPYKVSARLFEHFLSLENVADEVENSDMLFEDRHLYLTNQYLEFESQDIISKCSVLHHSVIIEKDTWLSINPLHFFIKYHCPDDLDVRVRREHLKEISVHDFEFCRICTREELKRGESITIFQEQTEPLRVFDPYAGVGAFGLSMADSGHLKTTHAVEISPSTAKALKMNSAETVVYNQCASRVLEYAYNVYHNRHTTLMPIDNESTEPLPPPPKPEDIDCIITGFPCQPHSTLNMFQKADDIKSDQILNVLAWVDFLSPKWCCFENVRGFMNYNLGAVQAGQHKVEGGVQKGGLRFLIRVLVTLGYQVRFGLLQAAHYGTPQARVRFILLAAKHGYTLPDLPTPTHNIPLADRLGIKMPNGDFIAPIDTSLGITPHQFVCVQDAIGDLTPWHWRNPPMQRERYEDGVELVECARERMHWGPINGNGYCSDPRTPFQARCRAKRHVRNLQHYTGRFPEDVIERVKRIPRHAGADYKSLNDRWDLWEYQFANPLSAAARLGHRTKMYGRLDSDGWFSTTVTNVGPTAKQSKVLHPHCDRIISVRELARSQGFPDHFEFFSKYDDVKMMHRQIGNAVPWQLGEALGRELLKARLKRWESKRKRRNQ